MKEETVSNQEELSRIANALLETFPQKSSATVIALHGPLGGGKTSFTQALAGVLGVTEYVVSPTFLLMRIYELPSGASFQKLIHIDAYRVEDIGEARVLNLDEYLNEPHTLIVVEWAEKIAELLPSDTVHLTFSYGQDAQTRILTYGHKKD